jgi:hypothetical protein
MHLKKSLQFIRNHFLPVKGQHRKKLKDTCARKLNSPLQHGQRVVPGGIQHLNKIIICKF